MHFKMVLNHCDRNSALGGNSKRVQLEKLNLFVWQTLNNLFAVLMEMINAVPRARCTFQVKQPLDANFCGCEYLNVMYLERK